MNRHFYLKLAINNTKKNSKAYIPYLLTCIGTIIMFYNMCFLMLVKEMGDIGDSAGLRFLLLLGAIVIGIFSLIFLFYTNSFLIKQRKKEFGLFNILGMEKRHIARIMLNETIIIGFISLISGLLLGILFSKLMVLLLFKIIRFDVVFGFEIPKIAVIATIILFGVIITLNLIYNIFQVHSSKPVELLSGGNVGEREPKTKWFTTVTGLLSLGTGYYLALTTESPLVALSLFFVAVILVMIGTHSLFTAGSIVILKSLRRNKSYYYKTPHFISISGMIYRMKQNASGLANICILSTAVIITLSTTVSMYVGMEDVLRTRFPRNISIDANEISDEDIVKIDEIISKQTSKSDITQENVIRYRNISFLTKQNGSEFRLMESKSFESDSLALLVFVTQDDYNELENKDISISEDEVLLYTLHGDIPGNNIDFSGINLSIKDKLTSFESDGNSNIYISNTFYIVVDSLETIERLYQSINEDGPMPELSYYYGFDVNVDSDTQIKLINSLQDGISNIGLDIRVDGAEASRASFYTLYGGLFFLGIFLGLLFIMATVLIIYYKQIAEGFDDKNRYEIMQKVGMSRYEIKKSIKSQILMVFFLPLFTAVVHIGFAFNMITKLLSTLNLSNVPLFALFTVLTIFVFAVFYSIVYILTARTYYKIVS